MVKIPTVTEEMKAGGTFFHGEDTNTHWEKQEFQQQSDDWAQNTLHKMKQTQVTPPPPPPSSLSAEKLLRNTMPPRIHSLS